MYALAGGAGGGMAQGSLGVWKGGAEVRGLHARESAAVPWFTLLLESKQCVNSTAVAAELLILILVISACMHTWHALGLLRSKPSVLLK